MILMHLIGKICNPTLILLLTQVYLILLFKIKSGYRNDQTLEIKLSVPSGYCH